MLMLTKTHAAVVAAKDAEIKIVTDERDRLIDDLHEAQFQPWPKWAEDMKSQIRAVSGYDGYDDAHDGINLPDELSDLIDELTKEAEKNTATARAERKQAELETAVEHYRKQANDLRARLAVFTAPRARNDRGHFISAKGASA